MAHAAAVQFMPLGPMDFKLVVTETDAGPTTEHLIELARPQGETEDAPEQRQIPAKFRLLGVLARKGSGSATTIAPTLEKRLGNGTDFQDLMAATADAEPSAFASAPVLVHVEGGALRHRAVADAGEDNATRTEWLCRRGWSDADYDVSHARRPVVS